MLRGVQPIKPLFGTNQEAFERVQKSYRPGGTLIVVHILVASSNLA